MNKDQAKATLALRAVVRLSEEEDDPWTMKQLFAPAKDSDVDNPTLKRYATQKTWQRDLIQRLIKLGLVEKVQVDSHHVAYQGVEREILDEIIRDNTVEDGEVIFGNIIKWLVFPASYEIPGMFKEPEPEPVSEPEELEESEPEEGDEVALASLQLLTEVSEHLIEIRKSHKNLSDRFETLEVSHAKVLELLPNAIGDSIQIVHDRSFEKLEKGVHAKLDAMAVALSALIDECRKLIANVGMADKVSNLKSQLDIFNNIVQSLHTQSKDFAAGMETVLDVMGEMEENATESTR